MKDTYFSKREQKCAKCGKEFISAPYHIYKKGDKWYCSWTCYNHRNDPKESKGESNESKYPEVME